VAKDRILAKKTRTGGLLCVHTGKGKGKTTAAMGMVMRCIGHGQGVGIVQFVKGKWDTGERVVLEKFPDLVDIAVMGEGFTWETQDVERDRRAAEAAWEKAKEMIESGKYGMVLLDEINIVLRYDYLALDDVVDYLKDKPEAVESLAELAQKPSPAYLEANEKLWAEAVKEQQALYRKNQTLAAGYSGLIDAAKQLLRAWDYTSGVSMAFAVEYLRKALSSHVKPEAVESLAELAKQKGLKIKEEGNWFTPSGNHYRFDFSNGKQIVADSQHRKNAELAAREYLTSLPDAQTTKEE